MNTKKTLEARWITEINDSGRPHYVMRWVETSEYHDTSELFEHVAA